VFHTDGELLTAGATLRQPALARTLQTLASDGPEVFYDGELGASMIRLLADRGAALQATDLAGFAVEHVEPVRDETGGATLLTAPPISQGFLLPLILRAVDEVAPGLDPLGEDAAVLARIIQLAVEDRNAFLGDPAYVDVPVDRLLAPRRLADVLTGGERSTPSRHLAGSGDTAALVTLDSDGNCVPLIQSLFHSFGAGILDPVTGIICQNRGAYFSLDPDSPNVLAPGKRPAHTLMPAMVLDGSAPRAVLGTMGGSGQPQILSQILLRLQRGSGPEDAVAAPRWVYGGMEVDSPPDELLVESRVPDVAKRSLERTGFPTRQLEAYDENVGHA
jgi:gamma-glutamyltranspeptidase